MEVLRLDGHNLGRNAIRYQKKKAGAPLECSEAGAGHLRVSEECRPRFAILMRERSIRQGSESVQKETPGQRAQRRSAAATLGKGRKGERAKSRSLTPFANGANGFGMTLREKRQGKGAGPFEAQGKLKTAAT